MINKTKLMSFSKIFVFLFSLTYIYNTIDIKSLKNTLSNLSINFSILSLLLIIFFLGIIFQSLRLKSIHNYNNKNVITLKKSISITSLTNLTAEITFIFAYLSKYLLLNTNISKLRKIAIILVEKFFSFFALIILSFLSLILLSQFEFIKIINFQYIFIISLISILLILVIINVDSIKILFIKIIENINYDKKLIIYILLNSTVIQILSVLGYLSIILFLNLQINYYLFVVFLPLATLLSALPISFTNFGYRESIFIFVYNLANIDSENVIILSLVNSLFVIITSSLVSIFFFKK